MPRIRAATVLLAVLVGLVLVSPAAADVERQVGGYHLTAGFARTPVYAVEGNQFVVRVRDAAGQPVTGLEQSLRVRVSIPNQVTETWQMQTRPNAPGDYYIDIALPRAAPYTFNLLGTIGGQTVDEKFLTELDGLDKVITRGRQYPRGSWVVVLVTFGGYLVGLVVIIAVSARRRARNRQTAGRA